jgi:putative hydrolase of the HAD superfamily
MHEIQAVLFDYGMVLSGPPAPSAWARMLAITGLDEAALHREYWALRHDYDRGTLSGVAYWHKAGSNAGITLTDGQVTDLIVADLDLWGQINQPMLDWAQRLQRAGIRTGILSNIGDEMASGYVARFDWLAEFHHAVWSHALKMAKPEPAIYRHAAEGLETPPAHILFVDDREENIRAAIDSGMQAIQYSSHDAFLTEMNTRGLKWLLDVQPAVS